MINILFIAGDANHLDRLESGMKSDPQVTVACVNTGADALERISDNAPDLVVVDEILPDMTGIDFGQALIRANPMVNCALVSSLDDEAFHEASEGMGVLMQIPVDADETFAGKLLERLRQIVGLSS